jgi:21S rRNA (uridine2791-2'-O)-methyltransferase
VVERTKPDGRVIGIDIIPAQPPKGVSTIQGNFLSQGVQDEVKRFLMDPNRGRPHQQLYYSSGEVPPSVGENLLQQEQSYIQMERHTNIEDGDTETYGSVPKSVKAGEERNEEAGKTVDVVLSDMSAPFDQITGFWKRSLTSPYIRMMNTSGINFRDHAGSMASHP